MDNVHWTLNNEHACTQNIRGISEMDIGHAYTATNIYEEAFYEEAQTQTQTLDTDANDAYIHT